MRWFCFFPVGLLFVVPPAFAPCPRTAVQKEGGAVGSTSLEPDEGPFVGLDVLFEYRCQVRHILLADAPPDPVVRMVVLPSFDCEWAVDIDAREDAAIVSAREAVGQIWEWHIDREGDRDRPTLRMKTREISKELVGRVHALWWRALKSARFSTEHELGLDGTNYHFAAYGNSDDDALGSRSAKAWSPRSGVAAALVGVGEALREVATSDDDATAGAVERLEAALRQLESTVAESKREG